MVGLRRLGLLAMFCAAACASPPKPMTAAGDEARSGNEPRGNGALGPTSSPSSTAPGASAAPPSQADPPAPATPLPSYGYAIWEVPLSDGFVEVPDPFAVDVARVGCMGLTVHNLWDRQTPGAMPYVKVTDSKGRKVYLARGRRWSSSGDGVLDAQMSLVATVCGDLNADGIPELLLTEHSQGAHCCYTYYAVSMTRPATTFLMWDKGDAGTGVMPVKAKPGKTYQLISGVVTWPRFGAGDAIAYSYSGAPIVPIIFQLEGTSYRARTFRYATFLGRARERASRVCGDNPFCSQTGLADWGEALIIGDWDKQREQLDFDAREIEALDRNAERYRRQLERLLGR